MIRNRNIFLTKFLHRPNVQHPIGPSRICPMKRQSHVLKAKMSPLPEQTERWNFGCVFPFKPSHSRKVCTENTPCDQSERCLPVIFGYSAKGFLLQWRA